MSVQRSTYEAMCVYINRHLNPYFDSIQATMETLTPMQVQTYALQKMQTGRKDGKSGGLSLISVRKHISILKQAFKDACLYGYMTVNPANFVRLPKRKSGITKTSVLLTAEEAQQVVDIFRGHVLYAVVILSLYYGLRRSEVLGLKWSAIDFEKNTIKICHVVVKNLTIEAKDTTKSESSERTFQLLPEIKTLLWGKYQNRPQGSEYINCWENGRLLRPDYVTKAFGNQLAKAGIAKMRFHDLRHSTASILFDQGWGLEDVKQWLGHADIETTSNIYLHYGKKRKILMGNTLSGMLSISEKV